MNDKKTRLLGIAISVWPFIALTACAVIHKTFWNAPGAPARREWVTFAIVAMVWTATLPLTIYLRRTVLTNMGRHKGLFLAVAGNIAYTVLYLAALYFFFLIVAFEFNHVFI